MNVLLEDHDLTLWAMDQQCHLRQRFGMQEVRNLHASDTDAADEQRHSN